MVLIGEPCFMITSACNGRGEMYEISKSFDHKNKDLKKKCAPIHKNPDLSAV